MCASKPVPLSKVLGQVPLAFDFVCGAHEQDDQWQVDYSDDATSDVHSFNPNCDGVTEVVDGSVRSTLVVKSINDIVTIPINGPRVESKNIFEMHNAETQTDELVVHGLTELVE